MKFDPLRYEHLKQMAQIEQEAFDQPWSERMFIPEVEDENAYYLVGVRGDEVVCYGGFHKVLDEAHITNIAVKAGNRGKGIGTLLMSELISRARLLGIKAMTLEVKDINLPRSHCTKVSDSPWKACARDTTTICMTRLLCGLAFESADHCYLSAMPKAAYKDKYRRIYRQSKRRLNDKSAQYRDRK